MNPNFRFQKDPRCVCLEAAREFMKISVVIVGCLFLLSTVQAIQSIAQGGGDFGYYVGRCIIPVLLFIALIKLSKKK